jgi:hypothetical protein
MEPTQMTAQIKKNAEEIRKIISEAAEKSGRTLSDITLIGVTKTVPLPQIRDLLNAGITHLGENRVQDFLPKFLALSEQKPAWHFIGTLQRNKTKQIIDKVTLIHSVDSIPLAMEINKRAREINRTADILIEINIANEPTKHGIPAEKANEFSKHIFELSNTRLRGLMCVAPFVENSEKNRLFFAKMRDLSLNIFTCNRIDITNELNYNSPPFELSMGMSNDYRTAVEEGATMVRIGTALVQRSS